MNSPLVLRSERDALQADNDRLHQRVLYLEKRKRQLETMVDSFLDARDRITRMMTMTGTEPDVGVPYPRVGTGEIHESVADPGMASDPGADVPSGVAPAVRTRGELS